MRIDQDEFHCHLLVLQSYSTFFDERNCKEIDLTGVSYRNFSFIPLRGMLRSPSFSLLPPPADTRVLTRVEGNKQPLVSSRFDLRSSITSNDKRYRIKIFIILEISRVKYILFKFLLQREREKRLLFDQLITRDNFFQNPTKSNPICFHSFLFR